MSTRFFPLKPCELSQTPTKWTSTKRRLKTYSSLSTGPRVLNILRLWDCLGCMKIQYMGSTCLNQFSIHTNSLPQASCQISSSSMRQLRHAKAAHLQWKSQFYRKKLDVRGSSLFFVLKEFAGEISAVVNPKKPWDGVGSCTFLFGGTSWCMNQWLGNSQVTLLQAMTGNTSCNSWKSHLVVKVEHHPRMLDRRWLCSTVHCIYVYIYIYSILYTVIMYTYSYWCHTKNHIMWT